MFKSDWGEAEAAIVRNPTDEFIKYVSALKYSPYSTIENTEAQGKLFEVVQDTARREEISLNKAFCQVAADIAHKQGTTTDALMQAKPIALNSVVRKVALRCGFGAPGWGCGGK